MSQQKDQNENDMATEEAAEATEAPTVEDLVPGLEEELARLDAEAAMDAAESDDVEEDVEPTVEEIIAAVEEERDSFKDKWTRSLAESENVRRRAERDRKDAATYGGTKLARDLLGVYDNLERALKAADDTMREQAASFIEGVELTQRELINAFAKHRIEPVVPEPGEKFDPHLHQAMFEAPIPGAEPGTVIECMQSGFVIADRLLRPAMVGVAKAVDAPEPENGED